MIYRINILDITKYMIETYSKCYLNLFLHILYLLHSLKIVFKIKINISILYIKILIAIIIFLVNRS